MIILTFIIKYIVPLITILTLVKAIIEYRKTQIWKESEFLSKEIKEFFSDSKVITVLTLLDWNSRKVNINGILTKIDDKIVIDSLQTHDKKSKFSLEEAYIRDIFDSFFDKLSYFNIHCKNGLFSRSKVHNYFEYYFRILTTNERKSVEFISVIDSYLSYYGYNNVKELLEDYKKRENSSKNFFKKLKYEILKKI
jgi:hypothetical protein